MLVRCFLALAVVSIVAGQDSTFSTDVNVVTVYATVLDPKGRTIRDLTKEDFTLEEDGKPQTIRYFSREFNAPLTVGLVFDMCEAPRVIKLEKIASYALFNNALGYSDRAFVLNFGQTVALAQGFTNPREKLGAAVAGLKMKFAHPYRCYFFEAVQQASEIMKPEPGRKAFTLLSAGMDHGSRSSPVTAVEFAQRGDVTIYSVLFQTPLPRFLPTMSALGAMYEKRGRDVLERLARETGGGYFLVTKDQPIEKIFAQIEEELRAQYVIGYTPDQTNANHGYRELRLMVKNRDLAVHSREGYYPK